MDFKAISPGEWDGNVFERIGTGWMLVTSGAPGSCNTMTASWGQMGILWQKPVATVYLRPSRYTREFVEREGRFSLSLFEVGTHRAQLELLGSKSGRDGDKIAESGLTVQDFDGVAGFAEAQTVLVCRTLYKQDLAEADFLQAATVETNYPLKDFHRMYVGEVEHIFIR